MKLRGFSCDFCGNTSDIVPEDSVINVFPYQFGWIYIHNMDIKFKQSSGHCCRDNHFCSEECVAKYIKKQREVALYGDRK